MSQKLTDPIVVKEDFITDEQNKWLIDEIKKIEDKFQTYRKQHENNFYLYERIFLNDYFKDNEIQIFTRQFLEKLGYNPKNLDITITSYGTYQRYDWHYDDVYNRTHNYILYLTDQQYYKGGELEIMVDDKIQKIIPKKNMLVIMDTKLKHRVLPVETAIGGFWQMSRLTLNGHIKKVKELSY